MFLVNPFSFVFSDAIGSISVTPGSYTRGTAGVSPTLATNVVSTSNTTGPYFMDLLSVTNGTTPSQSDMDAGSGTGVIEKVSIGSQANIEDLDGALDLSQSVTNGRLYVQYRDSDGAKSSLASVSVADTITYDADAPIFSSAEVGAVDATSVIVTFDKALYGSTSAADWDVQVAGAGATESAASISGSTVDITLGSAVTTGQAVTVAYTGSTLLGVDAEISGTFTAETVTNTVSGGGGATIPTDADRWLRLDASDSGSITDTSGDVTQVDDLEGSNNFTTANGTVRTGDTTQNSLNVFDFDGVSDPLEASITLPSTDFAIHFVADIGTVSNGNDNLFAFQTTDGNTLVTKAANAAQFDGRVESTNANNTAWTGGPYSGWHLFTLIWDTTNSLYTMSVDGTSVTTGTINTDITLAGTFRLMANPGGVQFLQGSIAEFIITENLVLDYDTYLNAKWGL